MPFRAVGLPTFRGFFYHRANQSLSTKKRDGRTWPNKKRQTLPGTITRSPKPSGPSSTGTRGPCFGSRALSACGKSTIANTVDHVLHSRGKRSFVLDGDNIRLGLNKNLGFSAEDRAENIRRIGEVAKLFCESGAIALTAFISPYKADRDAARALLGPGEFIEIFVKASVDTCEERDPKGLYKKARAGEIKNFTGISDPYEAPEKPELVLDSDKKGIDDLAHEVVSYLEKHGFLSH